MAIDRQGTGRTCGLVSRRLLHLFQASASSGRWFVDTSLLAGAVQTVARHVGARIDQPADLHHFAIPGDSSISARLVPARRDSSAASRSWWGSGRTIFAFIAFFHGLALCVASGIIFELIFLTNRAGLPVLGSTLGLAVGGVRLPWSLRGC